LWTTHFRSHRYRALNEAESACQFVSLPVVLVYPEPLPRMPRVKFKVFSLMAGESASL
jgi:hypothetical protein